MSDDDLTIMLPGEGTVTVDDGPDEAQEAPAPRPRRGKAAAADDGRDAQIAALELEVAQLKGANADLADRVLELTEQLGDGVKRELIEPRQTPIVGADWRGKTTAEAMAAGVRQVVLCSDGYFVPPPVGEG